MSGAIDIAVRNLANLVTKGASPVKIRDAERKVLEAEANAGSVISKWKLEQLKNLKRTDGFGTYNAVNLDDASDSELKLIRNLFFECSNVQAKELLGDRVGYVGDAHDIGWYAHLTLAARKYRKQGKIKQAMKLEESRGQHFVRIPFDLQW
jgi:hypothetical protein